MSHSFPLRRTLQAISLLPALALAQEVPQASDPGTPVPAPSYRSVLTGRATGVEAGSADWVGLNAAVGQFPRGHVDILKWEQAQAARPAEAPTSAPPAHHHPPLHRAMPLHAPAAPSPGGRP
jgi:hypothetical protein